MFDKGMLITAIGYESGKRETLARLNIVCNRTVVGIEAAIDELDRRFPTKPAPCTGDIRCQRTGVRHKKGCLGKVEPIDVFWKKVQSNG